MFQASVSQISGRLHPPNVSPDLPNQFYPQSLGWKFLQGQSDHNPHWHLISVITPTKTFPLTLLLRKPLPPQIKLLSVYWLRASSPNDHIFKTSVCCFTPRFFLEISLTHFTYWNQFPLTNIGHLLSTRCSSGVEIEIGRKQKVLSLWSFSRVEEAGKKHTNKHIIR